MNDAFLSIVAHRRRHDLLMVRARVKGHIERVFPKARVYRTPDRDYLFRACVPRPEVGKAVAKSLREIEYGNFKDSVADDHLHTAYAQVWGTMLRLQNRYEPAYRNPYQGSLALGLDADDGRIRFDYPYRSPR